MKKDEKHVSSMFNKLLTLEDITETENCFHYVFKDAKGQFFEHWQVKVAAHPKAQKQANIYMAKMASCRIGDKVYAKCKARMMDDGNMYADVDQIIGKF